MATTTDRSVAVDTSAALRLSATVASGNTIYRGTLVQLVDGEFVSATDAANQGPAWLYSGEGPALAGEEITCHRGAITLFNVTADLNATSCIGGNVYVVDNDTVGIDSAQTAGVAEVINNAMAGILLAIEGTQGLVAVGLVSSRNAPLGV